MVQVYNQNNVNNGFVYQNSVSSVSSPLVVSFSSQSFTPTSGQTYIAHGWLLRKESTGIVHGSNIPSDPSTC